MERWDKKLAVTVVALVIAVGEPRRKFSQVALPDWLTAQRTERLRAGCPAIHYDEFQMPPPNEKQNTASVGWKLFGGGAQANPFHRRISAVAN